MKRDFLSALIALPLLILAFAFAATIKLTGKVTDEKGRPIRGASVWIKGMNKGTTTDTAGKFSIEAPGLKSVLVVQYIGFEKKEFTVGNKASFVIRLKGTQQALAESVVVGYGTQQRRDMAGSTIRGTSPVQKFSAPRIARDEEAYDKIYQGHENEPKKDWKYNNNFNREGYDNIVENRFLKVTDNPLSTFSIDVDAASYSNIRRMLNYNQLPPAGSVRIEEMINYFTYQYPQPTGSDPFSINTEIAVCPWNKDNQLVSIGLQGKKIPTANLPPSNLTFLIDVSGSMETEDKLPLVKSSMKLLIDQLREQDKVSIVVYAGNAGLVLPPTSGAEKMKIKQAIDNLHAGGSTAGGQGIMLAYKTAKSNFIKEGNNRVILCTDGDFNVGISSDDELERLIEEERKTGIFLTVLGYGTGNYQDAKMQKLADKGNGNHAYIDNQNEAKKVLVSEFGGTLFTIAKDVKLQIEFNPAKVQGFRLIGYENRMLAKEDFNNDKKDAGELGSGHTVTALYEVVPVGAKTDVFDNVDELRYQKPVRKDITTTSGGELMNVKLRYKKPDEEVSKLITHPVMDAKSSIVQSSENLRFAAAVAQFGMLLRNSTYKGEGGYKLVEQLAGSSLNNDAEGYRKEFVELVEKAQTLSKDLAVGK
ncbi:MAG: von Willebrand factor type A domain-containing protein [Segetibacter sp.]